MINLRRMEISDEQKIKFKLTRNQWKLKHIDKLETRSKIKLMRKGSAIFHELWQEKTKAYYHFFITVIGVVEARIDDTENFIEFSSKMNDNYEVANGKQAKKKYLKIRKTITDQFLMGISGTIAESESIENALKEYPVHAHFSEIAEEELKNSTSLSLPYEFMQAYNEGYIASKWFFPEDILLEYQRLYTDLDYCKKGNIKKIAKCKKKYREK